MFGGMRDRPIFAAGMRDERIFKGGMRDSVWWAGAGYWLFFLAGRGK